MFLLFCCLALETVLENLDTDTYTFSSLSFSLLPPLNCVTPFLQQNHLLLFLIPLSLCVCCEGVTDIGHTLQQATGAVATRSATEDIRIQLTINWSRAIKLPGNLSYETCQQLSRRTLVQVSTSIYGAALIF